jgi:hypothetical protein
VSDFLKAEQIVATALGLLVRSSVLPGTMWQNAVGDFKGAKDDTVSIRVPAYAPARTRALRSRATRDRDQLFERKVDITLDTDVYKDVPITDEQLSLDIADFGAQVLNPVMAGIATKITDLAAALMQGAIYQNVIDYTYGDNPVKAIAIEARRLLNAANVPIVGRSLALGGNLEAEFLGSEQFLDLSKSGSTTPLKEGSIGRVMGFDVFPAAELDPDEGYAYHKTAYAISNRAPVVPSGAPFGSSQSYQGFAMRMVRVLDSTNIEDILALDSWLGLNVVTDIGSMDGDVFTPAEDPDESGASELFVRAVQITASGSL